MRGIFWHLIQRLAMLNADSSRRLSAGLTYHPPWRWQVISTIAFFAFYPLLFYAILRCRRVAPLCRHNILYNTAAWRNLNLYGWPGRGCLPSLCLLCA